MKKLIIVSPHQDDAAFSCGILLSVSAAANVQVEILNVFTRSAYAPFARAALSIEAISDMRKAEDLTLQKMVGKSVSIINMGLFDAPLRLNIRPSETLSGPLREAVYVSEVEALQKTLQTELAHADCYLLPLALGSHIDHLITRGAGMGCGELQKIAFYEDLPYAARLDRTERKQLIAAFMRAGPPALRSIAIGSTDGASVKRRFSSCYPSQVDSKTVEEMASYAQANDGAETFYAGPQAFRILHSIAVIGDRG